jgi:hypothetical protein
MLNTWGFLKPHCFFKPDGVNQSRTLRGDGGGDNDGAGDDDGNGDGNGDGNADADVMIMVHTGRTARLYSSRRLGIESRG